MTSRNLTGKYVALRNTVRNEICQNDTHQSHIKPQWLGITEEINECIKQINDQLNKLEIAYQNEKRITFDDQESKNYSSEILSQSMLDLLKVAENKIKMISYIDDVRLLSADERVIRSNAMKHYIVKLQDVSKRFHKLQSTQRKEITALENVYIGGSTDHDHEVVNDEFNDPMSQEILLPKNVLELKQMKKRSDQRTRQIIGITTSVSEIVRLMKDLQSIIIEQGTLVDRIDYNIENAKNKVCEGTHELKKAENYSKTLLSLKCIVLLIILIIILVIGMTIKHSM